MAVSLVQVQIYIQGNQESQLDDFDWIPVAYVEQLATEEYHTALKFVKR